MSAEQTLGNEATQSIVNFLKNNIPKGDVPNIEAELKKDFTLAKQRSKTGKKKQTRKKTRCLTRTEKKALGFYNIPRNSVKYEDVLPMHQIWSDYMSDMLELHKPVPSINSNGWENFAQTLYKADFHGSFLQVVRSKCASYVFKEGICVMDTRNTFKIVSKDNVMTTIPKKECVFKITVKNLKITVFGKYLCVRPAERSAKKVKSRLHPDL